MESDNREIFRIPPDKVWSKFGFLDESGSLSDPKDPFFTIGLIKCMQPYYLNSKLKYERTKRNFHDELKFNKLSKNNFDFAKFALESFLDSKSKFSSYTLYKNGDYFNREFGGDVWNAYENISIRLLEPSIGREEILILIADYITVPKHVKYEVNVKRRVNEKLNRLAVAGVCRFDSKGNDLLQVTDLLIGAINYELKLSTGIIQKGDKYKRKFAELFKNALGCSTFIPGFKNHMFNIFVDKSIKWTLPLNFQQTSQVDNSGSPKS